MLIVSDSENTFNYFDWFFTKKWKGFLLYGYEEESHFRKRPLISCFQDYPSLTKL